VHTGKLEGKRPLGRTKRSWDDNIKTDLNDVSVEGVKWTDYFGTGITGGCKRSNG